MPTVEFCIARRKEKHNRAKFLGLYLDDIHSSRIIGETQFVSLTLTTLGICHSCPLILYQSLIIYSNMSFCISHSNNHPRAGECA